MKLKKYKRIFPEGKQVGILYHFTYLFRLKSILISNTLKGNLWTGGQGSSSKKEHYVSFTRNPRLDLGMDNDIRIAIDGNKLSNKYKISPFYDIEGIQDISKLPIRNIYSEDEERIKGDVKNIKDYIINIDINEKIAKESMELMDFNRIVYMIKKFNIPYRLMDKFN